MKYLRARLALTPSTSKCKKLLILRARATNYNSLADMTKKEYERKETIGNLLTFALVLFGAILGATIIKEILEEIAYE